jgi:hypothetical protein
MRSHWARITATTCVGLASAMPLGSWAAAPVAHTPQGAANAAWAPWQACLAQAQPLSCAASLEAHWLQRRHNPIQRQGLQLIAHWPGAKPMVLVDDSPGAAPVLVGPLSPDNDSWLIALWPFKANRPRYALAYAGANNALHLAGLPWPAPHGRLFVTLDDTLTSGADTPAAPGQGHSVDLWQRSGARWSRLVHYEAGAGLTFSVKGWRADGAAVRLLWQAQPGECSRGPLSATAGELQLRDGPYGWDFVPTPPAVCGP